MLERGAVSVGHRLEHSVGVCMNEKISVLPEYVMVMTEVAGRCVVETVCVCAEDVCMCLVGAWQYASVCVCVCRQRRGSMCVP